MNTYVHFAYRASERLVIAEEKPVSVRDYKTALQEIVQRNKGELLSYELEGEEGFQHIDEYSDYCTERGKKLRDAICRDLHLASLEFQSLDGIIEAIGIEKCKLCTYCWNGKE